jgi:DNA topoisomerase-2
MQVAQLAGYVAEHSAYHHGEASLMSTIIGLAQDYVGSNNINLLVPSGALAGPWWGSRIFGSRSLHRPKLLLQTASHCMPG